MMVFDLSELNRSDGESVSVMSWVELNERIWENEDFRNEVREFKVKVSFFTVPKFDEIDCTYFTLYTSK